MAWTKKQLIDRMVGNGWDKIGQSGAYRHKETGKTVYLDNWVYSKERAGRLWVAMAEAEELPPVPRMIEERLGHSWRVQLWEEGNGRYIHFLKVPQNMGPETAVSFSDAIRELIENGS